jgi:hypothetical protein
MFAFRPTLDHRLHCWASRIVSDIRQCAVLGSHTLHSRETSTKQGRQQLSKAKDEEWWNEFKLPGSPERAKRDSMGLSFRFAFLGNGSRSESIAHIINQRGREEGSSVRYEAEQDGGRTRPDGKLISAPQVEKQGGSVATLLRDLSECVTKSFDVNYVPIEDIISSFQYTLEMNLFYI